MGSDDLFKRRKGKKKQRKENNRRRAPERYLIICEGKETEPNYFNGIKSRIDKKYKDRINVDGNRYKLNIKGTGRNIVSLVEYTIKQKSLSSIPYDYTWIIFDKDDILDDDFDNAIKKAKSQNIRVAWSNESIELWFLLHFEYLNTQIRRDQYIEKLSKYFEKKILIMGNMKKILKIYLKFL